MTSVSDPSSPWLGDLEAKPAPGALRRIQALINTIDRESGLDRLTAIADAAPWLIDNALLASTADLTPDDLAIVVAVREALRAMIVDNTAGRAPSAEAVATLSSIAAASAVRAVLDDDATVRLVPDGDTVRARLLDLLLVVRDAQLDGSWAHLKACANEECQWAFYDRSRNHGGTWCDMNTCGNKLKNRDFRARKRSGGQVPHERGSERTQPVE